MKLLELFDQILPYSEINQDRFLFKIEDLTYNVDFYHNKLPKESRDKLEDTDNIDSYEVDFSLITDAPRGFEFGLTDTGHSIQVLSTINAIIFEFLEKEKPDFLFYAAKEKSRQKLYDRMTKSLISKTNYELFDTVINNYGKNYILRRK